MSEQVRLRKIVAEITFIYGTLAPAGTPGAEPPEPTTQAPQQQAERKPRKARKGRKTGGRDPLHYLDPKTLVPEFDRIGPPAVFGPYRKALMAALAGSPDEGLTSDEMAAALGVRHASLPGKMKGFYSRAKTCGFDLKPLFRSEENGKHETRYVVTEAGRKALKLRNVQRKLV